MSFYLNDSHGKQMEDIIINLRVIGCLEPYQRLHTRQTHFRIYEHKILPEWIVRWLDGATRRSDFGRIRDIFMTANDNRDYPGMEDQINKARHGLESLKKTYENDQTMQARIDTLMDMMYNGV